MATGLYPDDGVVPCPCSCDRVDTGARVPLEGTRHSLFVASLARRAVRRDVRRNVRVQDGRVDVFAWDPRQDSPCGNRKVRHHGLGRAPNLLCFPPEPKDKLGGDTWRSGGTQESCTTLSALGHSARGAREDRSLDSKACFLSKPVGALQSSVEKTAAEAEHHVVRCCAESRALSPLPVVILARGNWLRSKPLLVLALVQSFRSSTLRWCQERRPGVEQRRELAKRWSVPSGELAQVLIHRRESLRSPYW